MEKAFTTQQPGSGYQEANLLTCAFRRDANKSHSGEKKVVVTRLKICILPEIPGFKIRYKILTPCNVVSRKPDIPFFCPKPNFPSYQIAVEGVCTTHFVDIGDSSHVIKHKPYDNMTSPSPTIVRLIFAANNSRTLICAGDSLSDHLPPISETVSVQPHPSKLAFFLIVAHVLSKGANFTVL